MKLHVQIDNAITVRAPRIEEILTRIADSLDGVTKSSVPAFSVSGVMEIPRVKESPMIDTGNHFFDLVSLRFTVSPNGVLDAPPVWSSDVAEVALASSADGLSCDAVADVDVAAFAITVTAPADNSSTPELESVSESFTGSFSHSKATSLGGAFTEIPR